VRFFRRRQQLRPLGEAEAYARVHGERTEVKVVHLPPRGKRYELPVSGEHLRRRFEERLAEREPDEADVLAGGEVGDQPVLGEELASLVEAEVAGRDEGVGGVEVVGGE
jgi:hypothetical protein